MTAITPRPVQPEASAPAAMTTQAPADAATGAATIVAPPDSASAAAETGDVPDEVASQDLWERIREGFAMPDLDNGLVRNREQYYAARPDYVQRMTERASRYLFHIVEEVQQRGLPTELALLPFIESAFNPQALSSARASGMWQFIPSTGRHYDLKQNLFRDERRDVLASTRAALDYLTRLHGMFGDWHLALAAYNWGEGSVQRAIARNRQAGRPTDYESLRMPTETRYYVPKLQAIKNIVARPEAFGLALNRIENHPYFLTVEIQRDMDVDVAVELAGLTRAEFMALNPQLNKPVILAAGVPQLLLPYDNAKLFMRNLRQHRGPLASWTAWVVPKTQPPAELARQVGMSEAELRAVNKIPPNMVVKAGSTLLIPRNERKHAQDVSGHIADNATLALAPNRPVGRRLVIRAAQGDTVARLAKRYRVPAAELAAWNGVSPSGRFARGQQVVVYTRATPRPVAKQTAQAQKSGSTRQTTRQTAKAPVKQGSKTPVKVARQ
ncbi:transglycosylase SLT domain-containing protein [Caldimonas caldifontis]|uniref:transglycosylase SLT domain-containing protein n=1 Tax=Caldimonas caldifontis TaxID=1452508 RepID=UPI003012B10F